MKLKCKANMIVCIVLVGILCMCSVYTVSASEKMETQQDMEVVNHEDKNSVDVDDEGISKANAQEDAVTETFLGEQYNIIRSGFIHKERPYYSSKLIGKFTVPSNGRIKIKLGHVKVESIEERYADIIIRSEGTTVLNEFLNFGLESVETYYITVTPGEYEFTFYRVALGITSDSYLQIEYQTSESYSGEIENNDSFDTANEILVNKNYTGDHSKTGDIDYFRLDLHDAGKVTIDCDLGGAVSGFYSEDEYGNVKEIGYKKYYPKYNCYKYNVMRLPAGTYYFKVGAQDRDSEYSFSINFQQEGDTYEKEWNDYSDNANKCLTDVWYTGNVFNESDADWYEIDLNKSSLFKLEFQVPRQIRSRLFSISLYDRSMNNIYKTENTNNPYICSEILPLEKGKYYICVKQGSLNMFYEDEILKYLESTYDYSFQLKKVILTNLKAVSSGKNQVYLSWSKVENANGYLIYSQKNGKYGYCGMTTRGTTFTDVNAMDSDYNYYWVFPYVKDAEGKMITGDCEKYVFAKGICPAVTNLKASSVIGGVKLTWTKSAGAEGYLIYGQVAGNKYGYVGMTTKGTTYTDKKASKDVYNYYWVFPYHKDASGKMIVGGTPRYTYGRAR